jgi:hypothetical protein
MGLQAISSLADSNLIRITAYIFDGIDYVSNVTRIFYQSIPDYESFKKVCLNFFCIETVEQQTLRLSFLDQMREEKLTIIEKDPYLQIPMYHGRFLLQFHPSESSFEALQSNSDLFTEYCIVINQIRQIIDPIIEDIAQENMTWQVSEEIFLQLNKDWMINKIHLYYLSKKYDAMQTMDDFKKGSFTFWNLIENPVFKSIRSIWLRLFDENFSARQQMIEALEQSLISLLQEGCSQINFHEFNHLMNFITPDVLRENLLELPEELSEEEIQAYLDVYYSVNMPIIHDLFFRLSKTDIFLPSEVSIELSEQLQFLEQKNYTLDYQPNIQFTIEQIIRLKNFLMEGGRWFVNFSRKIEVSEGIQELKSI